MNRLICLMLAACGVRTGSDPVPEATVKLDLQYVERDGVDPALLRLDLYVPAAIDPPLVIWVHGGAWMFGDKANQLDDKIALFTGAGWALASVNYRLSPSPPTDAPDRVIHPAHVSDVAAATAWLVAHADEYGVDSSRVALLGHSAGGHLSALLATDRGLGARPLCVGSFDTEAYDIPRALASPTEQQRALLVNAFTDEVAVQQDASPQRHVTADAPPFLIAIRGSDERRASQLAFAAAVSAEVIDASGLTHEEVNAGIGAAGDTIMTPPIMRFLTSCFGSGPRSRIGG